MKLDHVFLVYMAVVGIVAGAVLMAAPQTGDLLIKPYFWVLIAAALFDVGAFARGYNTPETRLGPGARMLGFLVGGLIMFAIATWAGITIKLL